MSQETFELRGTVQADGSLVLDEKLNLPVGPVRVTVQTTNEQYKLEPSRFFAMMKGIWADQKARGHVPRSRDDIDAQISELRDEADEEMRAVERLHEDAQNASQQSPEGAVVAM